MLAVYIVDCLQRRRAVFHSLNGTYITAGPQGPHTTQGKIKISGTWPWFQRVEKPPGLLPISFQAWCLHQGDDNDPSQAELRYP